MFMLVVKVTFHTKIIFFVFAYSIQLWEHGINNESQQKKNSLHFTVKFRFRRYRSGI